MAKKRERAGKVIRKTAADEDAAAALGKSTPKKGGKQPTEGFSMRMPRKIFARLTRAADNSGFSKTAIVLQGLEKRLNELEE